jgi:GDP-L-fucose synthase
VDKSPEKVFVAGHKGLVGSALVRTAPDGIEMVTASREELSLDETSSVRDFLFEKKIDSVILAAAKVGGIGANSTHHKEFLLSNLAIQNSVMRAASDLRVNNLIFLGSSCIYPKLAPQPISENSLLTGLLEETNEGYALAKIAGVRLAKAIFEQDGLNFFSLMPTNLYGPNDNFDLQSSHVPAALMRKFHEAKQANSNEVVVWGSGEPRREFLHVDDLAMACWTLLGRRMEGNLLNVGTGEDIKISEFARLMAEVVGYTGELKFDTSRPDGTPRKLLDVSKIHKYGWEHQIRLQDGLRRTYEWYVDALERGEVRGY